MGFDLTKYETVKSRKIRFYSDHSDGRITVESVSTDVNEYAYFKATVYLNKEDQEKGLAKSTGYAHEIRDKELKAGKHGVYESVNFGSWNENCEESAIGRALDNAGYSSNGKCSQEEMMQVDKKNQSYPKTDKKIEWMQGELYTRLIESQDTDEIKETMKHWNTSTHKMSNAYKDALLAKLKEMGAV